MSDSRSLPVLLSNEQTIAEPSAAFTPKPWEISEVRTTDGTFMVVGGSGQSFGLIADVTLEADARLIAAAPDLLACCQVAVASLKSIARQHKLTGTGVAIIDHIEETIAKARMTPSVAREVKGDGGEDHG